MPTINPVGTADIDFVRFKIPKRLDRRGITDAVRRLHDQIRYDNLTPHQRWVRRFDEDVTDLSMLPPGLFEAKAIILPRKHLPRTKEQLFSFCRKLIDRRQNEQYIELVLKGWPGGWGLEAHVELLWSLRARDRGFFEDVVRGRHGRALTRLEALVEKGDLTDEEGWGLIYRQGLLWCAMDSQMVTCGARASMIMPFGRLIRMTMKVFKAGTALRLMKATIAALEVACGQYQTADEEEQDGKNGAKPKGTLAKWISRAVTKRWEQRGRTVKQDRAELDDGIPYIRSRLADLAAQLEVYEHYHTDAPTAGPAPGEGGPKDNRLRHFHAVWYSNLSPAAGMAVGLIRLVMAERHLAGMVKAAADARGRGFRDAQPLPPLPTDPEELRQIEERVLDLAHAARLIHLRDEDCMSRTRKGLPIEKAIEHDPSLLTRDPLDKAGLMFIRNAFTFLQVMGQRPRDAYVQRAGRDPRLYTYWKMDCVPEVRLGL